MWLTLILNLLGPLLWKLLEPFIQRIIKRILDRIGDMEGDQKQVAMSEYQKIVEKIKKQGKALPEDTKALSALLCKIGGKCEI